MRTLDDYEYNYVLKHEKEVSETSKKTAKIIFIIFGSFFMIPIICFTILPNLFAGNIYGAISGLGVALVPLCFVGILPLILYKLSGKRYEFLMANRNVPCADGIVREKRFTRHRHDGRTTYNYYFLVESFGKLEEYKVGKSIYDNKKEGDAVLMVSNNMDANFKPFFCSLY